MRITKQLRQYQNNPAIGLQQLACKSVSTHDSIQNEEEELLMPLGRFLFSHEVSTVLQSQLMPHQHINIKHKTLGEAI